MDSGTNVFAVIVTLATATILTRALPFLVFHGGATPAWIQYIGRYLPLMVMPILVLYALDIGRWAEPPYGLPQLCACAVTLALHIKFRNVLLSIASGTAAYVAIIANLTFV